MVSLCTGKFGTNTIITANGIDISVHTSCSQPLPQVVSFGSTGQLLLVGFIGEDAVFRDCRDFIGPVVENRPAKSKSLKGGTIGDLHAASSSLIFTHLCDSW